MNMPARHVFIVNDFPPIIGGQSSYLYHLCRALPPEEILVLAPACKDTSAFDRAQAFRIVRKPYLWRIPGVEKIVKILFPLFWVRDLVKKEKPVLLHCAHVLSTGFVGLCMKKLTGLEYVVYTHSADILEYQHHVLLRSWLKRILSGAKYVVTNSGFTRARLEELGVALEHIIISPPRIDPSEFDAPLDAVAWLEKSGLRGRRILLSINRLVARKGNDTVIKAMPSLLKKFPDLTYVVFGAGPCLGMLRRLVRDLGLERAVMFIHDGDEARRVLLASCEIFVMVSRDIKARGDVEGFGVVYLEAGACGKAVVAGDSGGVRDAVEDGMTGFLVDPEDPAAVGSAIARLLMDPALAVGMGAYGRARVHEKFDFRRGVPELDALFKEGDVRG